ncbi:MAG: hypothetical protein K0R15_1292 [Clostridiales bacterium]|nr:hypothetical protein [Clostridiales bacterium]
MKRIFQALMVLMSLVSVIALGKVIINRTKVEKASDKVEIVVDYNAFEELDNACAQEGSEEKDVKWWLTELKTYGVTSVAIVEDSIVSLIQSGADIDAKTYKDLLDILRYTNGNEASNRIKTLDLDIYDIIVQTGDSSIFNRIVNTFEKYYGEFLIDQFKVDDIYYVILDGSEANSTSSASVTNSDADGRMVYTFKQLTLGKLAEIGIGFDPVKINIAKEVGLEIIPRLKVTMQQGRDLVQVYKDIVEEYELNPTMYIAADKEVIGNNNHLVDFADYIKDNNMSVVLIETAVQRNNLDSPGLNRLITLLEENQLARGITMSGFIQKSYRYLNYDSSQEITNMLYRAVSERNIRAIYFRPFLDETAFVTDENAYKNTIQQLEDRIAEHDLSKVLMSLGLLVALLLLLNLLIECTPLINVSLLITGAICIAGALFVAPNLSLSIVTLGYAITFPILVITLFNRQVIKHSKKSELKLTQIFGQSIIQVILSTLISILGGVFLFGLMAKTSYIVEIDLFRGVKIGQIIPIFAVVIIVLMSMVEDQGTSIKNRFTSFKNGFLKILDADLKIKYIVALLVIAIVGYVYIARTGHETNVKVSSVEIMLRNFFENTLPARPRIKEILIGIPALFAGLYVANRFKYKLASVALIVATIGQASILNTFQHQRTAMDISIVRTISGMIIGIIVGMIYVIVFEILIRIYKNYKNT